MFPVEVGKTDGLICVITFSLKTPNNLDQFDVICASCFFLLPCSSHLNELLKSWNKTYKVYIKTKEAKVRTEWRMLEHE